MARTTLTVAILDRRSIGATTEEVVQRGASVYAEQTRPVRYGSVSRRTKLYPSYEAYCEAADRGTLAWSQWR